MTGCPEFATVLENLDTARIMKNGTVRDLSVRREYGMQDALGVFLVFLSGWLHWALRDSDNHILVGCE